MEEYREYLQKRIDALNKNRLLNDTGENPNLQPYRDKRDLLQELLDKFDEIQSKTQ